MYNKSLFLSNAPVKSWTINIILKLDVSPTGIKNSLKLFLGGTVPKVKPIKAQFRHNYQPILKHITMTV